MVGCRRGAGGGRSPPRARAAGVIKAVDAVGRICSSPRGRAGARCPRPRRHSRLDQRPLVLDRIAARARPGLAELDQLGRVDVAGRRRRRSTGGALNWRGASAGFDPASAADARTRGGRPRSTTRVLRRSAPRCRKRLDRLDHRIEVSPMPMNTTLCTRRRRRASATWRRFRRCRAGAAGRPCRSCRNNRSPPADRTSRCDTRTGRRAASNRLSAACPRRREASTSRRGYPPGVWARVGQRSGVRFEFRAAVRKALGRRLDSVRDPSSVSCSQARSRRPRGWRAPMQAQAELFDFLMARDASAAFVWNRCRLRDNQAGRRERSGPHEGLGSVLWWRRIGLTNGGDEFGNAGEDPRRSRSVVMSKEAVRPCSARRPSGEMHDEAAMFWPATLHDRMFSVSRSCRRSGVSTLSLAFHGRSFQELQPLAGVLLLTLAD